MITPNNGEALPEGGTCHICGDEKAAKVSFANKPLCAQSKPCARRIRRRNRRTWRTADGCFASASTPGAQLVGGAA